MFSLHVTIEISPKDIPAFLEALRPAYEAVIKEEKNLYFEVFQDPKQPGKFRFIENWDAPMEWFATVQATKDYYKPYLAITEPMWIKPRVLEIYERMPGAEWVSHKPENFKAWEEEKKE